MILAYFQSSRGLKVALKSPVLVLLAYLQSARGLEVASTNPVLCNDSRQRKKEAYVTF